MPHYGFTKAFMLGKMSSECHVPLGGKKHLQNLGEQLPSQLETRECGGLEMAAQIVEWLVGLMDAPPRMFGL